MAWELKLGSRTARAEVDRLEDGRYRVLLDGEEHLVDYRRLGAGRAHLMDGARSLEVITRQSDADTIEVTLYGRTHAVEAIDERRKDAWLDDTLSMIGTPGGTEWWAEVAFLYSPAVREAIERRLANGATLPPPWTDTLSFFAREGSA